MKRTAPAAPPDPRAEVGTPCPRCGLRAEGPRCPRCNTVKVTGCSGSCASCAASRSCR